MLYKQTFGLYKRVHFYIWTKIPPPLNIHIGLLANMNMHSKNTNVYILLFGPTVHFSFTALLLATRMNSRQETEFLLENALRAYIICSGKRHLKDHQVKTHTTNLVLWESWQDATFLLVIKTKQTNKKQILWLLDFQSTTRSSVTLIPSWTHASLDHSTTGPAHKPGVNGTANKQDVGTPVTRAGGASGEKQRRYQVRACRFRGAPQQ